MLTYTLKIQSLYKETEDTLTISFKQPGLKKIKYLAGQYLTLIVQINGRRYIRPYSFSSAPEVDLTLDVTVKRVPGGIVSNYLVDKVQVGDLIEVMEPMGDFIIDNVQGGIQNKHMVLWGVGSGVTPLMSLAKYALNQANAGRVTLVYGNRTIDNVIFASKISNLKEQKGDRFSAWHFYTKTVIDVYNQNIIQGRINPHEVLAVMKKEYGHENTVHFICGPVGLKESVKEALNSSGINPDNIFSEDFELVQNPEEFKEILTRSIFIHKNGNKETVEVIKGKSILNAGLDALIDLSYSCQTGNCMVCKATIIKGEVKTIGLKVRPHQLRADECLLCCSYPLADDVEVKVE